MLLPDATIVRVRGGFRATIHIGRIELAATRASQADARRAVEALYEDALFGCDRSAARALRERFS